jgi:ATP-dependent helicase HepA
MGYKITFVQLHDGFDGVGKLVESDANQAIIEYFESPAGPRLHRVEVPIASVRKIELPSQTRIFWFESKSGRFRAGRVDGGLICAEALRSSEDHYHVRFPNNQEERLPISQLFVRWSRPIEDPTEYLAARITDTPFFFDGRTQIVRHIAVQRAAFGGLTALASSAVELLEHQVTIVRRVLADPIERYLLADEVGLGKTIEAGILIRQHIIDQPDHAMVLVVAPDHLVSQWKSELATKFFLSGGSPVKVVPESLLGRVQSGTTNATLLVVDEAHRIALRAFSSDPVERRYYEQLNGLARAVPRVLLLSGTPVLHQEEGFLAMLHLLDRDAYPLEDRDAFRDRVRERQTVAEATADLMDDANALFAREAIERIEGAFQGDDRLTSLCSNVREQLDKAVHDPARISALHAVRTHLSEAYRLHRRLLRTRRGDPRVQIHVPQRNGAIVIDHDDQSRLEAFDFLDAWRLNLADRELADAAIARLFASFVAAALSHPVVLLRHIDGRLALRRGEETSSLNAEQRVVLEIPWAFDGEQNLLEQRQELIAAAIESNEDRALVLATWLTANPDIRKVIVFVDDCEVADMVSNALQNQLGSAAVARYRADLEHLRAFEKNTGYRVLVCDATAEEGLNLQRGGAAVVHYDLPLEPTRVEQRIGRVDRIEARGQLRNVIFAATQPYEQEWQTCLVHGIRIFHRSVAPLQYTLAEATTRIRSRLATDGRTAFDDETARLSDPKTGLASELRRIQAQEAIDAIEINQEQEETFFSRLSDSDELMAAEGERSLNAWVKERLQFVYEQLSPNVARYLHDINRPTLSPPLETLGRFRACIDERPERQHSRLQIPLQPMTFDRATAETSHVPLLRVGHPFMQALEAQLRSDDRGTTFAMWRYVPRSVPTPRMYFRFDFFIESDLAQAIDYSLINSKQALRRRADELFPVDYRTIWLNSDLEQIRNAKMLAVLGLPYTKQPRSDGGRDVNIGIDRWERIPVLVQVGDWADFCWRARNVAEGIIRNDPGFQERCARSATHARHLSMETSNSLASRIARLSGATRQAEERTREIESSLHNLIIQGIECPSIRVDSVGVLVLASTRLENQ